MDMPVLHSSTVVPAVCSHHGRVLWVLSVIVAVDAGVLALIGVVAMSPMEAESLHEADTIIEVRERWVSDRCQIRTCCTIILGDCG